MRTGTICGDDHGRSRFLEMQDFDFARII